MDKKRSLLNVIVSIVFRVLLIVSNLLVRRYLIRFIGNDVNGINSLYLSVVGVLAVAELGVGEAITFCMYKPIVEGDTIKVSALYNLFKRIYFIIGLVICFAGCGVMPFLPYLAKGYSTVNVNLYLTFGLMLASVVITYFFSAKISLINAYKDNYITTTINSCGQLLQQVLQIIVLFLTQSFVWYLCCRIVAALLQWIATELITQKKYSAILQNPKARIDGETKTEVVKNVKALFAHKIGGVLVNTIDSIIISAFIGVSMLGKYSNYTTIMTAMVGTIVLFFTPLTSILGHAFVEDKVAFKEHYDFFYVMNFMLGCVFFLGYYAVIDDLVALLFGRGLELDKSVSFVITVNYFIQFMRQATLLFKNSSGMFYYDRWKPLAEGFSNLILSILFVMLFKKIAGESFAVVGVIVATIITNLSICHIVEPAVLYKHAFNEPVKKYYLRNYSCMALFVLLLSVLHVCMVSMGNLWLELLINGCIAVGIAFVPFVVTILMNKKFRSRVSNFFGSRIVK